MLMVVFGAGASYDSFPSVPAPSPPPEFQDFETRPPLASQLFANRDFFRDIARQYPKCLPLIADLEPRTRSGSSIEEVLEQYQAQADRETQSQLWAIRYYLRTVIHQCENRWNLHTRGVSNYSSLFNQARRFGHVLFVTFNYDTLLERSLTAFDIRFPSLGDYITDPKCTLFKLHGSIDWTYWIQKRSTNIRKNELTPDELIREAPPIGPTTLVRKAGETPEEAEREIYFQAPALAIPVVSKSEFVCPDFHLNALRTLLPQITHIAAIGWRASERHFLAMLGEYLSKSINITAICSSGTESQEILKRIRDAGVSGNFHAVPDTFTDFVRRHGIETFLK